jgi:hypothetical protein
MTSMIERDRLSAKVPQVLADLLGVALNEIIVRRNDRSGADLVISAAGKTIVVDVKKNTGAAQMAAAAKQAREYARHFRGPVVPLVAVPFMGDVGRKVCDEAGISWLDLSGNAHIMTPGLRVIVEGRPNRFRAAGRPPNLFAPKSSRIVRWLLIHPHQGFTQREISRNTGLDEGFVSRLVSRLEKEDYLLRDEGRVRPKEPALLLDAWRDAYRFSNHTIHKGHVSARSGDSLLRFVSDTMSDQGTEHAATGLAAAWVLTRFSSFRLATVYLPADPSPTLLERLGFREDPRGANLWLVVPNDAGIFQGAAEKDGIRCVHPVQVYLDLKEHPERASEAAERLRAELLTWRRDG